MGPRSAPPSGRLGPGGLDRLGGVLHAARPCRGGAGSQRPRRHPGRRRPHRQGGRPHGGRGPGAGGFRGATRTEHGSRCRKAARHRDRGTGCAHRRSSPASGTLHHGPGRARGPGSPDPGSYEVRPGDSLWSIAAARLGDGDDWPAIAALNLGRTMADGLQFVDPNTIHAGWTLEMPDGAAPLAPDAGCECRTAAPRPASPVPSLAALPRRWLPVTSHADISRSDDPPAQPFRDEALVLTHTGALEGVGPARLDLPELAALGIGALACAALTRRARRNRLLRQVTTEEPDPAFPLSPPAIDTGIMLARGAGAPRPACLRGRELRPGRRPRRSI